MNQVTLQVEPTPDAPSVSRSHLASIRAKLEPRYDDVVLLVSELVTNSVRHGASHGIDVKVIAGRRKILVEVADDGPGFSIDDPRGNGFGLSIVEKLADRWGMKSDPKFTVWAELSTGGSEGA